MGQNHPSLAFVLALPSPITACIPQNCIFWGYHNFHALCTEAHALSKKESTTPLGARKHSREHGATPYGTDYLSLVLCTCQE